MEKHDSAQGALDSAEVVKDEEGRQYHTATAPGEVADYVLMCGDPDRADRVAAKFDSIELENRYREYVIITGMYQGMRITVCATGIGCDNTEIAMVELSQCVENPTFLRIGTCGSLQNFIDVGELVISSGAVRLENTSTNYVPEGYPAVSDYQVTGALVESCKEMHSIHHVGITATCSGFYGTQGRSAGRYFPLNDDLHNQLSNIHVYNMEMEASTLLTLSSIQGFRAGVVCVVFANRMENRFIDMDKKHDAENLLIETGLLTLKKIHSQDQKKT